MSDILTEDTKTITLLCAQFGSQTVKPLNQTEYTKLTRWLLRDKYRPKDLLNGDLLTQISKDTQLDKDRLESLLGRGVQLGFSVEEWNRNGIWVISRSDAEYPKRYKEHLKEKSPPLLFGVGNKHLLQGGGLAVVGSRNVDKAGELFTQQVANQCAKENMPIVSGAARGVDQFSMTAALDSGGTSIGIVAENLLKKSLERSARHAISDGRLLLISPYHPNARFTVGTAMGRNQLIYAMADFALIVSADYNKGGTWTGAKEELRRNNAKPVFVRISDNIPEGNSKIIDLGALKWPSKIEGNIYNILTELSARQNNEPLIEPKADRSSSSTENKIGIAETDINKKIPQQIESKPVTQTIQGAVDSIQTDDNKQTTLDKKPDEKLYEVVIEMIKGVLETPKKPEDIANILGITKNQANLWLKRAEEEHIVTKETRPIRYVLFSSSTQQTTLL
jgi:predicted Rossmann fold nucleotide-binding protein DprA/Smf involved in DNA uptake